ncbi:uncharacterized protein LOC115720039 [Cannabis sativa]|uniref:uncharacterized protein LOC115720039 n=1 Tax=Cannabis sativa TaxID=3483 RepID=UPI0029C9B4D2|nr:uncharacterized protein LOC115720039 [Cannabis sativa]
MRSNRFAVMCRKAKYFKGKPFLEGSYNGSYSWFWKNVVKSRDLLLRGACNLITDGNDANVWLEPWVLLSKDFFAKPIGSTSGSVTKVAELLTEDGDWDIPKLQTHFESGTVRDIIKGGKPWGVGGDRWVWTKEPNGQFSTKSAYLILALERAPNIVVAPGHWNKLWSSKILEQHKVLWWSILSNALPIRGLLAKRINIDELSCPLCGAAEESMENLFLHCDFVYHLWRASPWGIFPVPDFGSRVWDWVTFIWNLKTKGVDTDKLFLYASIVVDTIWRTRNDKVHNYYSSNINTGIDSISNCFTDYADCLLSPTVDVFPPGWSTPPEDWIKINYDVKVGGEYMCIAALARDHSGTVLWGVANNLNFTNPLIGEAVACQLTMEIAATREHEFIIIKSDSEVVINAIKGVQSNWNIVNYVYACNQLYKKFLSCNFSFISRSCNFAAHNVARWVYA